MVPTQAKTVSNDTARRGIHTLSDFPSATSQPPVTHGSQHKDNKVDNEDRKDNTQIGRGGHNPQVQGNIIAGDEGSINLGIQGMVDSPKDNKHSPQDNKDSPQDKKDKKGNAQIGGAGHNPQVHGDIRVGGKGKINLGIQGPNVN